MTTEYSVTTVSDVCDELVVDIDRYIKLASDQTAWSDGMRLTKSGVFVLARMPGKPGDGLLSVCISVLTKQSLLDFLRDKAVEDCGCLGSNPYAEDVVGVLLGHGPLNPPNSGGML